jgi:hypothetical protein
MDMAMNRFFSFFWIYRIGIGPLHYLSSRSGFGFEFLEILLIEEWLVDSGSRQDCLELPFFQTFKQTNSDSTLLHYLVVIQKIGAKFKKCRNCDSPMRGFAFLLQKSPRIRTQNRNGSKGCVRDLCRTDVCKNIRKPGSLPCPFYLKQHVHYT